MAITIKREKNDRGVRLGSLKLGDTFMYDNRIGVVVDRNGHQFYLDLTTCSNFRRKQPSRDWIPHDYSDEISPDTTVLPISVELTYKVVG